MTLALTGDARERGRQHGEARREAIRARLAQSTPPAPLEPIMDPWWRTVRAASDEVAAELLGIAEGSGSTVAEILLLNGFEAAGLPQRMGCTAVATAAADGVVVAQNWDADEELAASLEVHEHRRSDGLDTVMLTSPGGLGWVGINKAGLALATTDLLTLGTRISPPSLVVRRLLLDCRTVEAALTLLARLPPAGGRSYVLGDATGAIAAVELCAERQHPFAMRPHRWTAHTNHALRPEVVEWESPERLAAIYPSSRARLARAQILLADDADAEAVLADHDGSPASVCRHPDPSEPTRTAASVVLDCAGRSATIALGPSCETPYAQVGL